MIVDTHSHIYDSQFDADRDDVVARAIEAGVTKIVLPAVDSESHESLFDLVRRHPDSCLPLMGLHPTSVNDNPNFRDELQLVIDYISSPPDGVHFCGVGEIGLDLHWSRDFFAEQSEVFRAQLDLAIANRLPVVIHTRDCWDEMCEVLQKYKGAGLKGVMHSFSGTIEHYALIKSLGGFHFGIGGPVTYKNSKLAEVLAQMELTEILLETDSPYLPPVPYRGQRNESRYITKVAEKVAEIKGVTIEELEKVSSCSAVALFDIK